MPESTVVPAPVCRTAPLPDEQLTAMGLPLTHAAGPGNGFDVGLRVVMEVRQ